jgi:DNA polymerase-3 subunit epsilon
MRWIDGPIMVFDTETTGLESETNYVIQLAIVKFEPGKPWREMEAWTTLAGSPKPIEPAAMLAHGITNEDIKGLPLLEQRMNRVIDILRQGKMFLAYNSPFDVGFLEAALARSGCKRPLPFNQHNVIDPLAFVRGLYRYDRGWKLGEMCARLGARMDRAHDALSDAMSAAEVMIRLYVKHDLPPELDGLMALQERYDLEWEERRRQWDAKKQK